MGDETAGWSERVCRRQAGYVWQDGRCFWIGVDGESEDDQLPGHPNPPSPESPLAADARVFERWDDSCVGYRVVLDDGRVVAEGEACGNWERDALAGVDAMVRRVGGKRMRVQRG